MNGTFPTDGLAANRALWDARARAHGTTPNDLLYDVDSFLAGRQTLFGIELELAGDVTGQDVLHLQCHFGMDTLNWARLGARVTGVDFSSTAIVRARELAELAGLAADFVEADTQNLPSDLAGRFDLVIATYGVLCWIGDLDAWMRGAAMALRPGGRLVLVDLHPAYQTLASYEPLVADWPYGGGQPQREVVKSTYADPDLPMTAQEVVQYPHSVGEIVTAAAGSGLIIDWLGEHTEVDFPGSRILPEEPDGTRRFPFGDTYLPILYSLRARSPRATTA
ncbi:methyltransferase domain-containing protein [Nonomuraea sp. NBC_01738]|uniref:class I SAM-dependent methyltransferase n=1 Tax=Nonomuraea sp. NBC_01738 TaxID=2976003 RepID=UPI002E12A43D|nr:methyltransferase domain-containing protein [Nonomuraea sp. NBC_01738]